MSRTYVYDFSNGDGKISHVVVATSNTLTDDTGKGTGYDVLSISGTFDGKTIAGMEGASGRVQTDDNVGTWVNAIFSSNSQGDFSASFDGIDDEGVAFTTTDGQAYSIFAEASSFEDETGKHLHSLTLTSFTPPCYCAGTRILTERGEVAVETLRIGDNVITASGAARPIQWIGRRDLDIRRHAYPQQVYPVRVRAGAFGRGLPHRDLWLSPQHAVYVDGVLIPIVKLANGANVAQVRVETVSYYHVELESHDVLLAEGLPAESFLDCGGRSGFSNAAGFVELHPTFQPLSWDDACAPLKEEGEEVEAVRRRLRAQAERLGFERSSDPGLHIRADGEIIWPEKRMGKRFEFVLPEGARELKLASRCWRPADEAANGDKRHLGVCVAELEIDGLRQALGALGEGWHRLEGQAGREWRWTDGSASLPVGARRLAVQLGRETHYWVETSNQEASLRAFASNVAIQGT